MSILPLLSLLPDSFSPRYHRILDLEAFRSFVDNGQLTADDFVTIQTGKMAQTTAHFTEQWNVQKYFMDYMQYQASGGFKPPRQIWPVGRMGGGLEGRPLIVRRPLYLGC